MQTNWIGRSEGPKLPRRRGDSSSSPPAGHALGRDLSAGPEHPLVEKLTTQGKGAVKLREGSFAPERNQRQSTDKEKTGEFIGAYAVNPVNGERVPIWVADYVMMGYGTGAIMAVRRRARLRVPPARSDWTSEQQTDDESVNYDPETMTRLRGRA